MDTERATVLSDRDYQELIAHRVHNQLDQNRKWRIGIRVTLAIGVTTILVAIAAAIISLAVEVRSAADAVQVFENPSITSLDSPWNDPGRLEIIGRGFGARDGLVELYYQSVDGRRSVSVFIGDAGIVEWSPNSIIAVTSQDQRNEILNSLGTDSFADLTPYLRVTTGSGQRSLVW